MTTATDRARTLPLRQLLETIQQNNPYISPGTLGQYRTTVNLVCEWAGREVTCEEAFRLDQLRAWVAWLCSTPPRNKLFCATARRATSTVRLNMLTFRTFWRLAWDEGACSAEPPSPRKMPKIWVIKEDPVAWSVEEMQLILQFALQAHPVEWWTPLHWWTILAAYFVSVERHSALLACETSDLTDENILHIRARNTKDGKPGAVHLPAWLAEAIRELPRAEGHWIPPYLQNRIWQWPFGSESMRNHLRADILEPAGLPTDRYHLFHCLRKSGITELVNLVGLEAASAQARHFSPGLTLARYVSQAKLRALPKSAVLGEVIKPL